MSTEAFITPDVLRWALERRGLPDEEVARRVSVKPERVRSWKDGSGQPTLRQAQALAQKLSVPLGYLFLSERPSDEFPLPDLRTVGDAPPGTPSPELVAVVYDALSKQQWYREYLESQGEAPLEFVGSRSVDDDPDDVARDIRSRLGVDDAMRQGAASWEQFLTTFIRAAEAAGILVLRSGIVEANTQRPLDVEEFRGFAISDDLAPLVFINGKDAKAAQIFTLAHEIAHLWLGESGVSNPDYRVSANEQGNRVERVCNRIAAETLLPAGEVLRQWRGADSPAANSRHLAARHRVSRMVALRRAYDLNLISRDTFWGAYDGFAAEWKAQRARPDGSGGDFYRTLLSRNSPTFTTALIASVAEGQSLHRDAARLLNVKAARLDGVAERLLGSTTRA